MIVGSVKEDASLDKRISITPETAKSINNLGLQVYLERKYAEHLGITDEDYDNVKFFDDPNELIKSSDLLAQVNCPSTKLIESFKENSIIKAKYYSKKTGKICIADDSGLEIDILNKSPGIYSSRWGGKNSDFNLAIKKVFREINKKDKDWKSKKIKCRFICSLTIYWPNTTIKNVSGIIEGTISKSKKGKNGFGYDPIFIPLGKNKTFGQMKPEDKFKIDHRAKAFKKIKKFL